MVMTSWSALSVVTIFPLASVTAAAMVDRTAPLSVDDAGAVVITIFVAAPGLRATLKVVESVPAVKVNVFGEPVAVKVKSLNVATPATAALEVVPPSIAGAGTLTATNAV